MIEAYSGLEGRDPRERRFGGDGKLPVGESMRYQDQDDGT
jgi:hypothetical protein